MAPPLPALLTLLALSTAASAAPFRALTPNELRADYTVSWADFSTVHGTVVPDWTAFPVAGQGNVLVLGYSAADMTIQNTDTNGGLFTPGVLLANPGPQGISIYPPAPVQGVGFVIEHFQGVQASYTLQIWTADVRFLGQITVPSPGTAGNPVFMGMVDPEARIGIVSINASPGDVFAITDPVFQLPVDIEDRLELLPVAATTTLQLQPGETYLHEGLDPGRATPATEDASEDFPNTIDFGAEFPGLRAGDLLHFERLGVALRDGSLNPTLGVFSSTETITVGTDLRRVPGALEAGQDFYTPQVAESRNRGSFPTPTNIPQDFVVGASTFVAVPDGASFAFLSLATPTTTSSPVNVRVGHIPRAAFLDWVDAQGLVGPNADPDSDLDGDSLTLLEEFAYLKDPTVADADTPGPSEYAFPPRLGPGTTPGAPLALIFGTRNAAPLRFRPEFSDDLLHWDPAPESALQQVSSDGQGLSVFRIDDPEGPSVRRFGRVRLELIPLSTF